MDDAAVAVLLFWDRSRAAGARLLISPETANILRRVDAIITLDQGLVNNYQVRLSEIQARLSDMTAQLPPPFCHASLPEVLGPEDILEREG